MLMLLPIILCVPSLVQESYAQEAEIREAASTAIDWIVKGINTSIDAVVERIDLDGGNPINATNHEKENVSEAGKKVIGDLVQTTKDTHKLNEAVAELVIPFEINPLYLFLLVGLISAGFMIKKGKKIIKFIIISVLVVIGIVAALAVLGIVSFGGLS